MTPQRWGDVAITLLIISLPPRFLLARRSRCIKLPSPKSRKTFNQVGPIVVNVRKVRRILTQRLTPSNSFRAPSLMNVSKAMKLRLCSSHSSEETRTSRSSLCASIVQDAQRWGVCDDNICVWIDVPCMLVGWAVLETPGTRF